jgi:hypothetical protein
MERSAIRDSIRVEKIPEFASLRPGYAPSVLNPKCPKLNFEVS